MEWDNNISTISFIVTHMHIDTFHDAIIDSYLFILTVVPTRAWVGRLFEDTMQSTLTH